MPSLRDQLEYRILEAVGNETTTPDEWDAILLGRDASLVTDPEAIKHLIRWNAALHEGLLWLAEQVQPNS